MEELEERKAKSNNHFGGCSETRLGGGETTAVCAIIPVRGDGVQAQATSAGGA